MNECEWTEDQDGNWETGCGRMYCLLEGTPSENHMRFCPFCGKPLNEVKFKERSEQ